MPREGSQGGLIPRPDEPYFTLRIKYPEHSSILALKRPEPKWLHTVALAQCNEHLTDGKIDEFRLKVICLVAEVPRASYWIKRLVDEGLWIDNGDGSYEISGFLKYNPSAAQVNALREKRRAAGRAGGLAKAQASALASATASAQASALADREVEVDRDQDPEKQLPTGLELPDLPAVAPNGALENLDTGRIKAARRLLDRIEGGDNGTPRVVAGYCKRLPQDRIDKVAATLRRGVGPGIAVNALKREVSVFEAELRAEGAA